jgi:AcrR family transcriptional regulator
VSATGAEKSVRIRLAAPERRAALLDCACRVFSEGSYRGTTTAEIAREAGVTEPILYRHFESKRDLYLACLTDAWERVRATTEEAIAAEPDPAMWFPALVRAWKESEQRAVMAHLWLQALVQASEDPTIAEFMLEHMREVHGYVAGVFRRSQAAGGILAERDPDAEAWISLGIGFLRMIDLRLGGLVEGDNGSIFESRLRWLTGRDVTQRGERSSPQP